MQADTPPKDESWDEAPALDLFTEELDPKLNAMAAAASVSTIGSGTSFSTAGTLCSFGTIGSACTT
jgi:hypothetical protein